MTSQNIVYVAHVGSINYTYFETRRKFTMNELSALQDIEGVTGYYVTGFQVTLNFGRAFSWTEIAPKMILVLANALGVKVTDLELRESASMSDRSKKDLSWIIDAALKLLPARNPLYPFALTADDVKPGVAFIRYNTSLGLMGESVFTSTPFELESIWRARTTERPEKDSYLTDDGIVQYGPNGFWNDGNFAVANTTEGRRQFINWLVTKGDAVSRRAAIKLIEQHLSDFVQVEIDTCGCVQMQFTQI